MYLRGLTLLAARGKGLRDAADAFGKAVELDPKYAQAWGALAETEQLLPAYTGGDVDAGMARAETAAQRALGIDPDTSSALVAMANVHVLPWRVGARRAGISARTGSGARGCRSGSISMRNS